MEIEGAVSKKLQKTSYFQCGRTTSQMSDTTPPKVALFYEGVFKKYNNKVKLLETKAFLEHLTS